MPNPAEPITFVNRIKAAGSLGGIQVDSPLSFTNPADASALLTAVSDSVAFLVAFAAEYPDIASFASAVNAKAPSASPALTGVPTAPTAAPGNASTQVATTEFVQAAISTLINAAPAALDTLGELAAAFGDDANFAATVSASIAAKQDQNVNLTNFAALTDTADTFPYFTGAGMAASPISAFFRSFLGAPDAATVRAVLGVDTVSYTESTPTNWDATVSTVAEALDQLAARLRALGA
jgi:hypothetical protein